MTTREILLAAADLIEKRGWAQGTSITSDGKFCLMGAVDWVTPRERGTSRVYYALASKLQASPIAWNDEYHRTCGEVLTLLRETANELPEGSE